jgi:hypothetical protein
VLIGSGAASAAASTIASLLMTIAIVLGCIISLAVLGGIGLARVPGARIAQGGRSRPGRCTSYSRATPAL